MSEPSNQDSISLNKFIRDTGRCSRRQADEWIRAGRVQINGQPTRPGNRVSPGDVVTLDGRPIDEQPEKIYIALNKPVGITSTSDLRDPDNIIKFVGHSEQIFTIGRLDKNSEGLILLTNDGDIVNKILRASNHHEKEYIVQVNKPVSPDFLQRMRNGVPILDTVTKKCKVEKISRSIFRITLEQGLNRQIRRMCEYLGYRVTKLKRVRVMNILLDDLPTGQWRNLRPTELEGLLALTANSDNQPAAQRQKKKPRVIKPFKPKKYPKS